MTLRQVLEVLWQRKLLVIASLIIVVAAAVADIKYSTKTYESVAIVKLNGAATASSDTESSYAGIQLDTDVDVIHTQIDSIKKDFDFEAWDHAHEEEEVVWDLS